jgi:PIN domain nuclease of toxin-antitoxin system
LTLLDAYALVALLADEPAAQEVDEILRGAECRVVVVNLAEAVDITTRAHGFPLEDVRAALEPLLASAVLGVAIPTEAAAWEAARVRAEYYDRKDCALSLADCFLLAQAEADGDGLVTADPPVAKVARQLGVEVIGLPDTAGRRP